MALAPIYKRVIGLDVHQAQAWASWLSAFARHVKAIPGRKTDVADAQWLATLARSGLWLAYFIGMRPVNTH